LRSLRRRETGRDGEPVRGDIAVQAALGDTDGRGANLDAERPLQGLGEAGDVLGGAAEDDVGDLAAAVLGAVEVK
jgi:hypothetical protein